MARRRPGLSAGRPDWCGLGRPAPRRALTGLSVPVASLTPGPPGDPRFAECKWPYQWAWRPLALRVGSAVSHGPLRTNERIFSRFGTAAGTIGKFGRYYSTHHLACTEVFFFSFFSHHGKKRCLLHSFKNQIIFFHAIEVVKSWFLVVRCVLEGEGKILYGHECDSMPLTGRPHCRIGEGGTRRPAWASRRLAAPWLPAHASRQPAATRG